jgi:nucleoside-diphosphate-sugar epimerase
VTTLVTGATGLLGSHVVDLLLERGERPRVLVRPGESLNGLAVANVEVHRGDVADRKAVENAVDGADRVLHCAARTGPWGPEAEYERTNLLGLGTLLNAALAADVHTFVHVSSAIVHGTDVRGEANESAPLRVEANPYSRTKVAGEQLLQAAWRERQAPVTIVRPGLIYGPRDVHSFARFANLIERRRMIVIGSGGNRLPLIYVCDAAQGVLLAADAPPQGDAYLLVNDEPVTQTEYLQAIARELDAPVPSRHIGYRLALGLATLAETSARVAKGRFPPPLTRFGVQLLGGENRFDIRKARRELGFSPRTSLLQGVGLGAAWYRAGLPATQTR